MEAKKKYLYIIGQLEKAYSERLNDERLEEIFKTALAKEFKLEVTSDALLEEVLRDYYRKYYDDLLGSQAFCEKLIFIDRINSLFYRIEFISRREYIKMRETISRERNSPANKWLENIPYLRSSASLDQFRYEFLTRYCDVKDEDASELLEDGSQATIAQIRIFYQSFFRRSLQEGIPPKIVNFIQDLFTQFENKSDMLSPGLIKDLEKRLGVSVGENQEEIKWNQILVEIAQENSYANDQEAQQRLEDEVRLIEKALQRFSGLNVIKSKGLQLRLGKFGSLTSGFAGVDADLDLTILTNCYINQIEFLRLLHQFLKKEYKLEESGRGGRRVTVELISQAKTPLIQLSIGERGRVDLKIDLIVNNILGVINSKFLSVYSQVRWIKNLGLLAKLWGKARNLIGKNALSSYAMILMLIHYLIKSRRARPIMDHRVTTNKPYFDFKRMKQSQPEQFKVYYTFKDGPKEASIEERVNYYKIFMGFMKYYAEEHWKEDEKARIITVDMSIDRKVDIECALTIKDPFDEPHNPGRLKAESRDFLIQKFKEAYEILKHAKEEKIRGLFIQ